MATDDVKRVVVLGAGPGGYAAAFRAADLGLEVTLVDVEQKPGGVCLYRGCIPSKTLLHAAKLLFDAKEAEHWGIRYGAPAIDLEQLRAGTDSVVDKMTAGLGQLCRARGIRYVQGRGDFLDSQTVHVVDVRGKEQEIRTDFTILAAGSRPATLPNLYLDSPRLMNSSDALRVEDVPEKLLVVGGGYIGLELGTVYSALGSRVTVVEMMPQLLPGADLDLVTILHKRIEEISHAVHLNTRVLDLREQKNGILAVLESKDQGKMSEKFDKVLVSVGRKPNTSGIGLQNTKVELDAKGFVQVDERRRTADPAILAIGDIAGEPMLAHKATHEGRVAAEVVAGRRVAFEPLAIPAVVFTDPEVAWVGLTEAMAKEQGLNYEVAKFPWGASGRATTLNRNDGLTKLIIDATAGRILGVGIVGTGAGELIAEGALAIEMGATAEDVSLTIHAHPTLSETFMESGELYFGSSTHMYRPKKKAE